MRSAEQARSIVAGVMIMVLASASARAQESSGRGFLFGAPNATLTLRAGYAGANAGSDVFSFVTNELTLRRGDFASFGVGGDLAITVAPRVDVVLSVDNSGMSKQSEFRQWQDNSGNPITQNTSFSRTSYTASARYHLVPQGRSLGRLAWVPSRYAPWVSAGIGRTSYSFSQNGDFIDFNKGNSVFSDSFHSSQWTTTGQVAAGVDWSLNQRFALTTQAQYLWGKGDLQQDYSGFDAIDLSGVGMSAGLTIRF